MLRTLIAASLAVSLSASNALAETAKVLTWDDLVPAAAPLDNPFDALSEDAKDDFSIAMRGRQDIALGFVEPGSDYERILKEAEQKLVDRGLDLDALIAEYDELMEEVERRERLVVPELEGEIVRLPGYALPLEFTEGGVREFLLVPYVGACIHTPPPPANQMVFVQLDEEYVLESLYDPVWITGRIRTEQASRSLSYMDGQTDVATGYAMNAMTIEPYE